MVKIKKNAIFIVFTVVISTIISVISGNIQTKKRITTLLSAYEIQRGFTGLHFNSVEVAPIIINYLEKDKSAFVTNLTIDVSKGQVFEHSSSSTNKLFHNYIINKKIIKIDLDERLNLQAIIYTSITNELTRVGLIFCFFSLLYYLYTVSSSRNKLLRNKERIEALKDASIQISNLSKQVAHDIRSPLAALEIVMDDIKLLPEDSRELTIHAINRIQNIANNLSRESKENAETKITFPSITIASVINEKKVEYQNLKNISINFDDQTDQCSCIGVSESELSRVVSNLINNSVEVLDQSGLIQVTLEASSKDLILKIKDSGPGFPSEILGAPISRGQTIGKDNGQGLGLYHASSTVLESQGDIKLSNPEPGGSLVEIRLPLTKPPVWFKPNINISKFEHVYVVDDDKSIHEVWKKILGRFGDKLRITDLYFENEIALSLTNLQENSIILIDYDLRQNKTGIDFIKEFDLENAVLVTSNYKTSHVEQFCIENKIQLIPKQIVSTIRID
jgi:signal transduction histidine kinase